MGTTDGAAHGTHLIDRRTALRGAGVGVAAAIGLHAIRKDTPAQDATPQATPTGALREFDLVAAEFDWEVMPGTVIRAWGYNGQVPGPEIRVREGDLVRVHLRNDLAVGTTIHWHGVNTTPAMDGPAGLNQAAVAPGETFTYEFIAKPGGTRWYHSHADPQLQVPMGLYGPLIIEPAAPAGRWDREYTLILQEYDAELTPAVAAGSSARGPRDQSLRGGELGADAFLVNGRMHGAIPPVRLAEGERILLRLINAGHMAHPVHTHGHSFRIVATDGNPVPEVAQLTKDTVLVGPAERYDLELVGDNPGVWMLHCHIEHHMANGMMTTIWYDGHEPTGPVAGFFEGAAPTPQMDAMPHDHAVPATPEPMDTPAPGSGEVAIEMVDDRFEPASLTIPAGSTVTWINAGADWHSVAAFDGSFESAKIPPGGSFSIVLPTPGTYQYICKHHGLQGMIGTIVVEARPP